MAGIKPTFISGANAKIRLNDKTLAFCTDLSYTVQVITQTPKVLGMFEGVSVEPLGYSVSGSFTVIRYAKGIAGALGNAAPKGLAANDAGNGVGNWGSAWGGNSGDFLAKNGVGNDGRANEALDPSTFHNGVAFDIQVYQKVNNGQLGVVDIRSVRITQADFSLTKNGVATQRFNFVALYANEDSFIANFSGVGQHFQG